MPPQTVPSAVWDRIDDKIRYALETYLETLSHIVGTEFSQKQAPFVFGSLSLLIEAISSPFSQAEVEKILSFPEVRFGQPQMWPAVLRIEREMERYYSTRLNVKTLSSFPSYRSAHDLVAAEMALWGAGPEMMITAPHQSFLIVGCGALPLIALLMQGQARYPITCLETDAEDAKLARRFLKKCAIPADKIKIVCADPLAYDYSAHPAILLTESVCDKGEVLARIRQDDSLHQVAIRAAVGLNGLLYEPLEDQLEAALFMHFDRRTVSTRSLKTTYFSAAPAEILEFEKEEPKPELIDVKYFPPHTHDHG